MGISIIAGVIFPIIIYKLLSFIHSKFKIRLYWILLPVSLILAIAGPYCYLHIIDKNMYFSIKLMMNYSIKTGFIIFLVIPAGISSILCTVTGYIKEK